MKRRETFGVRVWIVDSCHVQTRVDERRVWVEDRDGLRVRELWIQVPATGEWVAPIDLLTRREVA